MFSSEAHAAASPSEPGVGALRPEDVTKHRLPVVMRGYDREQTDRLLERLAEAYLLAWREGAALRERVGLLEDDLAAARGEAQASSKSVAELIQRGSTAGDQLAQTRKSRDELAAKLDAAERDRKQAVTELREVSERASDLERRLDNLRQRREGEVHRAGQPAVAESEVAALLIAATRAAEDVREASRGRALRTLLRARERAAQLRDEAEHERAAAAEMLERRGQAEREANEILAGLEERREQAEQAERKASEMLAEAETRRIQAERDANEILAGARGEAERLVTSVEDERHRVRKLLVGALESLDAEGKTPPEGLVADLSTRLQDPTAANGT